MDRRRLRTFLAVVLGGALVLLFTTAPGGGSGTDGNGRPCNRWAGYHGHSFGCHNHNPRPQPTPRPPSRPSTNPGTSTTPGTSTSPGTSTTPALPPLQPVDTTPRSLNVTFSGPAFTQIHNLLVQGGGPPMDATVTIRPGNRQAANASGTTTTVERGPALDRFGAHPAHHRARP